MSLGRKHRQPPPPDYPKTVAEAAERLLAGWSEEDKERFRTTPVEDIGRTFRTMGMGMRNDFGLWGKNRKLLSSLPPDQRWGDTICQLILDEAWRRLQRES